MNTDNDSLGEIVTDMRTEERNRCDLGHEVLIKGWADQLAALDDATRWREFEDEVPELGTECIVECAAFGGGTYISIDRWDEQREAPVSFSTATIPIGPGWDSDSNVLRWMPAPKGKGR